MKFHIPLFLIMFKSIPGIPLVFVPDSPWQTGSVFTSEGTCTYNITRTLNIGDWTMNVTTNLPTLTLTTWDFTITGPIGNTYLLSNKYDIYAGLLQVVLQFQTHTAVVLSGNCDSNIDPENTTTTNLLPTTLATETVTVTTTATDTITLASVTMLTTIYIESSYSSSACSCNSAHIHPNSTITEEELSQKVALLKEDLAINKKETSKAKNKKISVPDNRPSAKAVGAIGIIFLCSFLGTIILLDLPELVRSIQLDFTLFSSQNNNASKEKNIKKVEKVPLP